MSETTVKQNLNDLGLEEATQLMLESARRAVELVQQESRQAREIAGRADREREAMQDEIEIARAQLDAARNEAARSAAEASVHRRTARRSYVAAAAVGLVGLLGAVFTSSSLVRSNADRAHLADQLAEVRSATAQRDVKVARLQGELERVRLAEARVIGELRAWQASGVASTPANALDGAYKLTPTTLSPTTLAPGASAKPGVNLAPAMRPSVVNMLMELMPGPLGEPTDDAGHQD